MTTEVTTMCFTLTGASFSRMARDLMLSDNPAGAWRLISDGLVGEGTNDIARGVLDGSLDLVGDSTEGVEPVDANLGDAETAQYYKDLDYVYAGRIKTAQGWRRPHAVIEVFSPESGWHASKVTEGCGPGVPPGPVLRQWSEARADYYCGQHETAHFAEVGHEGVYVIFEPCGEPPLWLHRRNTTVQGAVDDALRSGRTLEPRGYSANRSDTINTFTKEMVAERGLEDAEADELLELGYAAEDEIKADRLRQIGAEVMTQAGGDTFELVLGDERAIQVPRAPFVRWALGRTEWADRAPEWQPVAGTGLKCQMDDPCHTDWLLGAGLTLDDAYDSNVTIPAYEEAGRIQHQLARAPAFKGIFSALASLRGEKATVIVDAGKCTGTVGEDIVVLANMDPAQVPAIVKATGVITEVGGPAQHLAIVARGYDITVLRVPGACEKFPAGTEVELDPKRMIVRILTDGPLQSDDKGV